MTKTTWIRIFIEHPFYYVIFHDISVVQFMRRRLSIIYTFVLDFNEILHSLLEYNLQLDFQTKNTEQLT